MPISKWQIKRFWMNSFAANRYGEDVYEWLTAVVLGTQKGMSRKWSYWFREHMLLTRRYARMDIAGKNIWLFQPGWSLAPVILSKMVTDNGPIVTEDRNRLTDRYLPMALDEVAKVAPEICRTAHVPETNLSLISQLRDANTPQQLLEMCRGRYHIGGLSQLEKIESGSADICISMGRLEHFTESDLRFLFRQMRRILVPGGIGSHIIDHRDHFWHYDKSIHCFNHLTFSDDQWAAIARAKKLFRNRLLEPDYARLFIDEGFKVLGCIHNLHRHDAIGVDPKSLWGRYSALAPKDLEAAVSHFIVKSQ